ncbi:MAG TPA: Rid family detoxifying hydrolase [Blastocatellia bacterium]|nr:Rid family detoxifying hydrolase [Blastocatellia bacterium]
MTTNRRRFIKQAASASLAAAAAPAVAQGQAAKASKKRSNKRKVLTDRAPKPVGPYSQAIIAGNTVYVAGQVPTNPRTGQAAIGSFEEQAVQTFENIKAIVEGAGATLDDVVRVNVYLADLANFAKMNEVYRRYFKEDFPARTTVGAQLLSTFEIEVDCIAVKG